MKIDLYVVENCPSCNRARSILTKFAQEHSGVNLTVVDLNKSNVESVQIVPALFLDGKLFSYGEVNLNKLKAALFDTG